MARNTYPGKCYRCGKWCATGEGYFEQHGHGWRVQCVECALARRSTGETQQGQGEAGGGAMTDEYTLTVHPFEMDVPKRAALKPLEEAAEVFGAWQDLERAWAEYGDALSDSEGMLGPFDDSVLMRTLADELADVIQAACNLAARYGLDMAAAMERCEVRNCARGRYTQA